MPNRLPKISRETADALQHEVAEEIYRDRNMPDKPVGSLWGMLLNAPEAARRVAKLGAYCRFGSSLPPLVIEAITLLICHGHGFAFEIQTHERLTAELEGGPAVIEAVRSGRLDDLSADLQAAMKLARAAVGTGEIPAGIVNEARGRFGDRGVTDVIVTAGYYSMLSRIGAAITPES
jgi:4-carboxymuconolactone decarboxylase